MSPPGSASVTQVLLDWSEGDREALRRLMPLVTDELHRLAERHLGRERAGHTLQPTALVNEVYLRLADQDRVRCLSRLEFFAFAGRLMRRILVDHARAYRASKRGSGRTLFPLDEALGVSAPGSPQPIDLLAVDEALDELRALDELQHRVVELRFFAGLTLAEIGELLGMSHTTVNRRWASAKAWLARKLTRSPE
jgi:RNA polymerase sigma factor (TIGR02999 family)